LPLFGKKPKALFKVFFATDLHGSEKCFRKFVKAAEFYGVDALLLGGDLTGKVMAPIVHHQDGSYTASFLDNQVVARTPEELADLERNLRFNGQYVYHCTPEEMARLNQDIEYQRECFRKAIRDELQRWMDYADETLGKRDVPCVGIPGNDDEEFVGEILCTSQTVANGECGVRDYGPFQLLSFGYSNPTPWNSPRELSEEQLRERMDKLADTLDSDRPTLFNVHVPPFDSGLDLAPELTDDLRLRAGASASRQPVGSRTTTELIDRIQPVASFHGHVHESRGVAKLGRTFAVNPGSEYNVGVLRGVIVTLAEDRVLSHQFVAA
jgi:Icc-related predicted phosphoesterase